MDLRQLETDILAFVRRAYPNIEVQVEPWTADPKRPAVYFTEAQFATLYPAQRYHYLRHLIPADYYDSHLSNSEWFELAPDERPEDLVRSVSSRSSCIVAWGGTLTMLAAGFSDAQAQLEVTLHDGIDAARLNRPERTLDQPARGISLQSAPGEATALGLRLSRRARSFVMNSFCLPAYRGGRTSRAGQP